MEESKFYQRLQESEEGREYLSLIDSSKERDSSFREDGYELHHIFPRGLGGKKEGKLAKLTIQEHVKAHELLSKIFGGKMEYAYLLMTTRGENLNEEEIAKARKGVGKYIKEHEIWKKGYQTKLKKEGKVWINVHTPEAEIKRRATKVKRYGGEFPHLNTKEVVEKRKNTLKARFGSTMGACHAPEAEARGREHRKQTLIERYGSETAHLHTEEVRKKASESRKRYYEERGMSATEMTHSPEAKAKRSETRAIKAKIRDSKEYSEWYEKQSKRYYNKGDGVKDFLKEKGLSYYREYGTGKSN